MSDVVHVIRAAVDPTAAPTREGQHWVNTITNKTWLSVGTTLVSHWVLVGEDHEVAVSATDTAPGYLGAKLAAGTGVVLTTLNPGANEVIEISAPDSTTDEKVKVSATDTTAGYLNTEITVSNGTNTTNPLEKSITSPGADEKLNIQFDQTKLSITASQVSNFNEAAQDAVGGILVDTATIDFTYNDAGNQITADLKNTTVVAGSYGSATQVPTYTVDAQGRLTAAANVSIAVPSTAITDFTEAVQDVMGGALVDSASIDFVYNDVANTQTANVIPGGVNHDALLNWVANKHIDHSAVSIIAGTGLSGGGDITASRTLNIAATGVTASSYGSATQVPTYIVNAQGQLTAAANVAIAIPSTAITDFAEAVDDRVAALIVAGTGITATYNDPLNTLTIATTITQYTDELAQDAIGTILTDTATIDFTYNDIGNQITADLKNTTVTAGSYGSATQVPTYTVDAQGRLTAAANVSIQIAESQVTNLITDLAAKVPNTRLINTGTGLTGGGDLSADRTISLAAIANNTILSNISGASAAPTANTLTTIIDSAISNVQGSILYRNATSWVALAPGTSGQVLGTGGAAANPSWISNTAGSVTSVGLALPSIFTVSGSPVTSAGTLTGTLNTQAANLVFAGPTIGVAATPTFRSLVAADIPALSYVTSIATGTGLTGGPITGSGTISIANTAVTASSYGSATQVATYTVNAQGQLTAAANVAIAIPSTQVTDFTEAAQDAVGGILTDTASIDFTYNDAGNQISAAVLPGGVDHDQLLNFVANEHINHASVSIIAGTGLTGGGDLTTSRTLSLANVGTAGTYGSATQIPVFTTNAQGQVTSVTNTTINTGITLSTGQIGFGSGSNQIIGDNDLFWDNTNKRLGIGTNAPVAQLHLADDTGQNAIFEQANNSLQESAFFEYRKAKGTLNSKLAVAATDKLGGWGGFGWDGTSYQFAGEMLFYAETAFTPTSSPGYFIVSTTPVGSTSPIERFRINSAGDAIHTQAIRVGTTTDTTNGNIRYNGTEFQAREAGVWKPVSQTPSYLSSAAAVNSTSASFATLSLSSTPAAGSYKLEFTASAQISAAVAVGEWAVFVGGVQQTVTNRRFSSVSTTTIQSPISITTVITVNGAQAVDVQFRRVSGTGTVTTTERELLLTAYAR
jgi:hypothetical protein